MVKVRDVAASVALTAPDDGRIRSSTLTYDANEVATPSRWGPPIAEAFAREVEALVDRGYHVRPRTDSSAWLMKPSTFSPARAFVSLILGVIPGVVYLLRYPTMRGQVVSIRVAHRGTIHGMAHGGRR